MTRFWSFAAAIALLVVSSEVRPLGQAGAADEALVKRARAIHDRVIALDTHADINPENFTRQKNYTQRLETQVNLPKMVEGGLDAAFFIVYVGQGPLTQEGYDNAYKQAVAKFEAVHHLTKEIAPGQIELALTAADVPRIAKSGKKVALIGIENAYQLGTDLKRVKEFYDRGGRYMSLAHNGHSQFADSNTGERDGKWLHNGLSELGKQAIAEMNKWGIMIDLSHPSKEASARRQFWRCATNSALARPAAVPGPARVAAVAAA
jgi:membrane dipeptidase